jgi:hypothetical protein
MFQKETRGNNYYNLIDPFKKKVKESKKVLNYDLLMTRNCMIALAIKRNKAVVK